MFSIVCALLARFKALFVTYVVLDLEADLIAACAKRKAELLRQAKQYEQEGLTNVAEQLRLHAESLSPDEPLGSVLTIIAHLQADQAEPAKPADAGEQAARNPPVATAERSQPALKKSRKS
jgi:hypothetical protein